MKKKTVKTAAACIIAALSLFNCGSLSAAHIKPLQMTSASLHTMKAASVSSSQTQWSKAVTALKNDMKNISFTITMVGKASKVQIKYFLKDQKFKGIMANGTVAYVDIKSGKMYSYSPKTKIALTVSATDLSNLYDYDKYISARYIGVQTVNGTPCDVFEASANSLNDTVSKKLWTAMGTKSVKLYISQANRYFVKQETVGKYNSTCIYSDVALGSVTDADVTLPADAKVFGK